VGQKGRWCFTSFDRRAGARVGPSVRNDGGQTRDLDRRKQVALRPLAAIVAPPLSAGSAISRATSLFCPRRTLTLQLCREFVQQVRGLVSQLRRLLNHVVQFSESEVL
jgi:hypothetical protein